ncbi:MAG: sugar phosphate isomerase/epimerase [Chloroflexi bacterium]|jgi:sugar phosphate isomerase/epimerase|nr:sugar phosphate isomerase/epimerase [Chloroflexota bacterium]
MNIGFVANGKPEDVLRQAARLGFDGVELGFRTGGPCDPQTWTADDTKRLNDLMAETGTRVLTVGLMGEQHLSPDPAVRAQGRKNMQFAIELAPQLGTNIVTTLALADPHEWPANQVALFAQVFGEYARMAEAQGVRIGIENWPAVSIDQGIRIRNLAYSPEMFERLFDAVPSLAVGLEYDPSHLYWQGADYVAVIRDFADRMVFMHAKDTEIFADEFSRVGIYGRGWWRYRIPGLGEVDWDAITTALVEVGYNAGVVIEHEDPVFAGERFDEGLAIGLKFLKQTLKA